MFFWAGKAHLGYRKNKTVACGSLDPVAMAAPGHGTIGKAGDISLRIGRGDWIRTNDPLLPKQALYQAELRPDAPITKDFLAFLQQPRMCEMGTNRKFRPETGRRVPE